jgi:hypothetical protein
MNYQAQYRTLIAMNVTLAARSTLACYKAAAKQDEDRKHVLSLAMDVLDESVRDLHERHVYMETKRSLVK